MTQYLLDLHYFSLACACCDASCSYLFLFMLLCGSYIWIILQLIIVNASVPLGKFGYWLLVSWWRDANLFNWEQCNCFIVDYSLPPFSYWTKRQPLPPSGTLSFSFVFGWFFFSFPRLSSYFNIFILCNLSLPVYSRHSGTYMSLLLNLVGYRQ